MLRSEGYSERAIFLIDKQGFIRYIDIHEISEQPNNEVLRGEIRKIDPRAAAREPKPQPFQPEKLPHGGIVMYCTRWCPDCKRARAWLQERNLPYTEVDIYATPGAEEQVRRWCNGSLITPTFDVNGTVVIDFNEQALRTILKL